MFILYIPDLRTHSWSSAPCLTTLLDLNHKKEKLRRKTHIVIDNKPFFAFGKYRVIKCAIMGKNYIIYM